MHLGMLMRLACTAVAYACSDGLGLLSLLELVFSYRLVTAIFVCICDWALRKRDRVIGKGVACALRWVRVAGVWGFVHVWSACQL